MQCSIVQALLIDLLYITQTILALQSDNADINRILEYLQEHDRHKNIVSDLQSILSRGENGYQASLYSPEDEEKSEFHDLAEDELYPEPNNDALLKFLSQKSQTSRVPKVKSSKNGFISKHGDADNNAEYSKVYLVLNPRAKMNKADLKGIGDIVSQLVSKKQKPKPNRYKGFAVVNDFLTRRRRDRDSSEKFTLKKDSIERDYKPKRSRNDYSGGTGRTAIPYIRHRGDIYERP